MLDRGLDLGSGPGGSAPRGIHARGRPGANLDGTGTYWRWWYRVSYSSYQDLNDRTQQCIDVASQCQNVTWRYVEHVEIVSDVELRGAPNATTLPLDLKVRGSTGAWMDPRSGTDTWPVEITDAM